jgi:hypothetical protein
MPMNPFRQAGQCRCGTVGIQGRSPMHAQEGTPPQIGLRRRRLARRVVHPERRKEVGSSIQPRKPFESSASRVLITVFISKRGRADAVLSFQGAVQEPKGSGNRRLVREGQVARVRRTAGIVHYGHEIRHRGWWYYKTLWALAPDYDGPVVITGHQIDGPHRLRFNASGRVQQQLMRLRFGPVPEHHDWRYGPSSTLIRAPGCYTFELRRREIMEFITFIAAP